MGKRRGKPESLSEAGARFEHEPQLQVYVRLHEQVLRAYGYRCAFTSNRSLPDGVPDPEVSVVAIRPRQSGGPLHVTNYLALSNDAADAFERGYLTIGVHHELIADLSRVSPELLARLNPVGRMTLPADPDYWPDPVQTHYHRTSLFDAMAPTWRGGIDEQP